MENPTAVPRLAPRPGVGDFFAGLSLPFRAMRLIVANRTLFWLTAVSSLVTLLTLSAVIYLASRFAPDLVSWMFPKPESGLGQALWWVAVTLTFIVVLVAGANTLPVVVLAPLQDPISEATEAACGDFAGQPFSFSSLLRGAWVALAHTVARIGLLLLGLALLFPLNFIPGLGSLAWTVLGSLWTIFWIATEYLDAPMARHLYPFGAVRRAVTARLGVSLGLGAGIYLMLWVPIVNFFFVPVAIVAGTLLFRGLRASGALGPPPGRTGTPTL